MATIFACTTATTNTSKDDPLVRLLNLLLLTSDNYQGEEKKKIMFDLKIIHQLMGKMKSLNFSPEKSTSAQFLVSFFYLFNSKPLYYGFRKSNISKYCKKILLYAQT